MIRAIHVSKITSMQAGSVFASNCVIPYVTTIHLMNDNGPQLVSNKSATFCGYLGVKYVTKTVYPPSSQRKSRKVQQDNCCRDSPLRGRTLDRLGPVLSAVNYMYTAQISLPTENKPFHLFLRWPTHKLHHDWCSFVDTDWYVDPTSSASLQAILYGELPSCAITPTN